MNRRARFRGAVLIVLQVALLAFISGKVWAQGSTPASFDKVTVSNQVADRTLMKAVINADTAQGPGGCVRGLAEGTAGEPKHSCFCLVADRARSSTRTRWTECFQSARRRD